MSSCWRGSCRRLTTRALWIICCTACLSSLVCVFLIINYLEDHRECNRNNLEPKTGSYSTSLDFHGQDPRNDLNDIFRENRELKRFLKRLTQPSSLGKVGSILPGVFHLPQGNIASWQERSLKYIPGDVLSPRLELSAMSRDETLNCKSIARIHILKEIGRGYTKVTQLGVYNGLEVAVKSSGLDSTDVQKCIEEKRSKNPEDCLVFSRYKIMKELLLYQQLHHPNIVKVSNDQICMTSVAKYFTVLLQIQFLDT